MARVLVGRWREVFADHPEQPCNDEPRESRGDRDSSDRDACRSHDGQFTVAREPAETDDAPDQGAYRQELVGLLGKLQQRDKECARDVVTALTDIVLLADEGHERHQREQHGPRL